MVLVENPEKHFISNNKMQMHDNIKTNQKEIGSVWTEYIWFRLGISGGF
jgi:hypothetical protein